MISSEGAYANLLLPRLLRERHLNARDAAFVTELVAGSCRWQGTYDAIIAIAADRPTESLQPEVQDLLRLGVHQALGMRTPPHAAVAATVDLAVAMVGERVSGLTNAVLRRIAGEDLQTWLERITRGLGPLDSLALRTAHPRWIVDAFADLLPPAELEPALTADNIVPPVNLAVRPGLADVSELHRAGARPGRYSPFAALMTGNPGDLAHVRKGRVGVQDEGSQLVAWGLTRATAEPGRWLDLCAGPGGKTALLTGLAAQQRSELVAVEIQPHRAELVAKAVRAYPPRQRPAVLIADGTEPSWQPGTFTRVLVDTPCTGLGALRRRPEARWRRGPSQVDHLHPLQKRLLEVAVTSVAPGGVIAYVTCSPHRRETVEVVDEVCAQHPELQVIPASELLPEVPDAAAGEHLQLWPHRHGTDAMFAAYLRRTR